MLSLSFKNNFKGSSVFLISGDTQDFLLLESALKDWVKSRRDIVFISDGAGNLTIKRSEDISSDSVGMKMNGDNFFWYLKPSVATKYADLIGGVARADYPCHAYLEDSSSDDVVVVSKGEYT